MPLESWSRLALPMKMCWRDAGKQDVSSFQSPGKSLEDRKGGRMVNLNLGMVLSGSRISPDICLGSGYSPCGLHL